MNHSAKHLVIIAGEASGDMHAAHLVDEIKKLNPNITFSGLGGEKMQASGVELYADLTSLAVVGFVEVIKHYKEIKEIFNLVLRKIHATKTDAVILVDYPGFNLRLAKELKKAGIKVIYYISPQVWAWKENRVKAIKRDIDKMLVLFDFEKDFYAKHNVDVEFVGHPLVDTVQTTSTKEEVLAALGLSPDQLTIGLLPGSRQKEIETLLPIMLEATAILKKEKPDIQFILLKAPTIKQELLEQYTANTAVPLKIIDSNIYNGINACDLCMVASGTATLETAILNKPMVVVYKTAFLTWLLAKLLIKIPYIGLVNVVARKKIVPECVQFEATGEKIAKELQNIYTDKKKTGEIKTELEKVKQSLGAPGASRNAAEKILTELG